MYWTAFNHQSPFSSKFDPTAYNYCVKKFLYIQFWTFCTSLLLTAVHRNSYFKTFFSSIVICCFLNSFFFFVSLLLCCILCYFQFFVSRMKKKNWRKKQPDRRVTYENKNRNGNMELWKGTEKKKTTTTRREGKIWLDFLS